MNRSEDSRRADESFVVVVVVEKHDLWQTGSAAFHVAAVVQGDGDPTLLSHVLFIRPHIDSRLMKVKSGQTP